ncbi:MAG TPA: hypothetical protein VMV69_01305 [Pirellulales bacterium]|nr:hypothetical protein [Pirellulales bacterium]
MRRTKSKAAKAAVEYKLSVRLDEVRQKLSLPDYAERLDKPLAYWVVANDRRLPLAFLNRTLGDLASTSLADLLATPGIGFRKVQTLIVLLNRASQPLAPGALAPPDDDLATPGDTMTKHLAPGHDGREAVDAVDAAIVSEALWVQWRATVVEHELEQETLGRLAQTLRDMPSGIWRWPLSGYTKLSLAEIRSLKTHGVKRVNAVLEVFGSLHTILAHAGSRPHMRVQIVPRSIVALEAWVMRALVSREPLTFTEVREQFVAPLLGQVRVDATSQVAKSAERRMASPNATVRQASQRMGLTRARVYQLFDEVADIVAVRWPTGRLLTGKLREQLHAADTERSVLTLFDAACDLFFPPREDDDVVSSEPACGPTDCSSSGDRPNPSRAASGGTSHSAESGAHASRPPAATRQGPALVVARANGQATHPDAS